MIYSIVCFLKASIIFNVKVVLKGNLKFGGERVKAQKTNVHLSDSCLITCAMPNCLLDIKAWHFVYLFNPMQFSSCVFPHVQTLHFSRIIIDLTRGFSSPRFVLPWIKTRRQSLLKMMFLHLFWYTFFIISHDFAFYHATFLFVIYNYYLLTINLFESTPHAFYEQT